MKKSMIMVLAGVLAAFGMAGCSDGEVQSSSYDTSEIIAVEVNADGGNVQLVKGSGDKLEVSYTGDTAEVKDGTLVITPKQGGFIHFKEEATVISVPDRALDAITIDINVGSVSIDGVNARQLTVTIDQGNITFSGADGQITAKTDSGDIKTELSTGDDTANADAVGPGKELSGQLGDSENVISLYTHLGTIELR